MMKSMKFWLLPLFALVALFAACNKNDGLSTEELDAAVDEALYAVQDRGGVGRFGCYELVFPVTLQLPDDTTVEVDSYEEMKQALRSWFQANGGPGGPGAPQGPGQHRPRPNFVFPISVVSEDGELITVNNQDELRALRAACAGASFGNHGHHGHGQHPLSCFELVFPITLEFPDGSTAQADSRQAMRQLIRAWHQANPGTPGRPKIVFPITVKMTEDGTLVTVNSRDELRALKESCE
jgi:hypothetical protein